MPDRTGAERPASFAPEEGGWTRQFVAGGRRLSEAVEMYEELGFEVRLEPLPPVAPPGETDAQNGECRRCYRGVEDLYKIIYTKPKSI